jgi:hypothetical protein
LDPKLFGHSNSSFPLLIMQFLICILKISEKIITASVY